MRPIATLVLSALPTLAPALLACGGGSGQHDDSPPPDAVPPGTPHALTVNDVSVLLPLDAPDSLLRADAAALGGALLPRELFDQIGESLIMGVDGPDAEYAALRVVAVRFDPCFVHNWGGVMCQPQIRLVMQAMRPGEGGEAFDGALHLLYNLDEVAFAEVVQGLRALTGYAPEHTGELPLQQSPALRAGGVDGPYGQGLHALVLAHAGPSNLARMTFMTRTDALASEWFFGGRAVKEYAATGFGPPGPLVIAGIDAERQHVQQGPSMELDYEVEPAFADPAGHPGVSASGLAALDVEAQGAVHDWAFAIERPTSTTPDSTDCASCHVAMHVRATLEALTPSLLSETEAAEQVARAPGAADGNPANLRALGYFGSAPVISQRTANETAFALAGIESMYPAP